MACSAVMAPLMALLVLRDTAAALTAICSPACWPGSAAWWPKVVSAWASGWDGMSKVALRPAWASSGAGSMAGDCARAARGRRSRVGWHRARGGRVGADSVVAQPTAPRARRHARRRGRGAGAVTTARRRQSRLPSPSRRPTGRGTACLAARRRRKRPGPPAGRRRGLRRHSSARGSNPVAPRLFQNANNYHL